MNPLLQYVHPEALPNYITRDNAYKHLWVVLLKYQNYSFSEKKAATQKNYLKNHVRFYFNADVVVAANVLEAFAIARGMAREDYDGLSPEAVAYAVFRLIPDEPE